MRANIPKGMGGGPQNMQAMLRQAQKMQEDMAAKQEELDAREYDISAGGGVVNVKINGKKQILALLLALLMTAPAFVSCSDSGTNEETTDSGSAPTASEEIAPEEPAPAE